jgi:hypothetical protein
MIGLQTIVITYCDNLETIRMFAFRHLPNLKSLIISNNPMLIDLEPHALGNLRNLNYLSLSMNKLQIIDGYIFSTSSNIKIIDFIGNPIKVYIYFKFKFVTIKDNIIMINYIIIENKKSRISWPPQRK